MRYIGPNISFIFTKIKELMNSHNTDNSAHSELFKSWKRLRNPNNADIADALAATYKNGIGDVLVEVKDDTTFALEDIKLFFRPASFKLISANDSLYEGIYITMDGTQGRYVAKTFADSEIMTPEGPSTISTPSELALYPAASDAVLYTPQTLTEAQQKQARDNIGALDVNIKTTPVDTNRTLFGVAKNIVYVKDGWLKPCPVDADKELADNYVNAVLSFGFINLDISVVKGEAKSAFSLYQQGLISDKGTIFKNPLNANQYITWTIGTTNKTYIDYRHVEPNGFYEACRYFEDGTYGSPRASYALMNLMDESNPRGTVGQYVMSTNPTEDMHIATKQYVDTAKTEAQQLGLTAATPGQIIKVKTVQDGKPTEWEAVDMPSFAPAPFKPEGKSYLTFSSSNRFTLAVYDAIKHWNGILEYFSADKVWAVWDGTTTLSAVSDDGEYVLYLRGAGNTVITGNKTVYRWVLTGSDIKCIGNIENLLDYATVTAGNHPTMANYCYACMFQDCTGLTKAPALPATTLADYCYSQMFQGCTSLTQAPELPATTLAKSCYFSMFSNCTALTQAPTLPATTLGNNCYANMFFGCTALTQAPALPATTLTNGCYNSMFNGCTSLTKAPELPATTLANNCYYGMFRGCISLTQAPALPATTLATHCYYNMFSNCAALTQAPALPATTLAAYCYNSMFRGCTALKLSSTKTVEYAQEYRIPTTGTGTTATDALTNMFVSTGGTFTGTPEINTTYYLSNDNMIVRDTEVATLNGYVGSMIDNSVSNPLNITGATVGQIAKITAVDESGKPTSWEAVDDRLPKVSASDAGNVLGVEQIGEHEYGYALTHMPTLNDFIPLGITNASPGQFAKVSFVDDFGNPTAWEAADIYDKPASGIPKSDLEQSVQTSLAKADTAISYNSQTLTEEQKSQARTNIGAGQPVFAVNVTGVGGSSGYTADKTAAEIEAAYQAGRTIVCKTQARFLIVDIPVELPLVSRNQERVFIFSADQLMGENAIFTITVNISDSGVEVSTKGVEIYEKPASGIPKSDLEQSVQTSLAKADTSISYDSQTLTDAQKQQARTNIGAVNCRVEGNRLILTT